MKKLFLILLALNFASCSQGNVDNDATEMPTALVQTFNPEPTPQDYLDAKYPKFMESIAKVSANRSSQTSKTTAWVNTYVPDAAFRAKLISLGAAVDPVPGDNYVDIDTSRGGLNLNSAGISDLTGINGFTSLYQLTVNGNSLTSLNITGLTNLGILECNYNSLTGLNLTANTNLSQIWCYNNLLTSLTLPSSTNLWGVWCYGNKLATLNLNGNIGITNLFIQGNKLTSFNFAPFVNLAQTNVSTNKWVTLNFNSNVALVSLWCYSNSLLTDLTIKNGFNTSITNQNFNSNIKSPPIHVDATFLTSAPYTWPQKGTSTYVL